jgi:hypothetical protein
MNIPSIIAASGLLVAVASAKEIKSVVVPEKPAPVGHLTLGSQFSEELSGVNLNALLGIWTPASHDAFLFIDAGFHYEDNGQAITSLGLGYRQMLGDNAIVGANVFWDYLDSEHDNDIHQLGLGLELLTQWVDARLNYYVPEDDTFTVSRSTTTNTRSRFVPGGISRTTERTEFTRFETGLEGFNAEVGFLIPGLEKIAETRIFAGYYHYDNPFGSDFDGFKARLEARVLKGVTANVEYWDDKALMGGHWTAGIAVSVPFDIGNLFAGKNPFEGASESFQRVPRRFQERLSEDLVRSHRVQTTTSGPIQTSRTITTEHQAVQLRSEGGQSPRSTGGGFPIE